MKSTIGIFFVLLVSLLFLSSCVNTTTSNSEEISCDTYLSAAKNVDPGFDYLPTFENFTEKCEEIYIKNAREQKLCHYTGESIMEDSSSQYCNLVVGYFAKSAKICQDSRDTFCVQGFALNPKNNCNSFVDSADFGFESTREICFYIKGLLGDESACKKISDTSLRQVCENPDFE